MPKRTPWVARRKATRIRAPVLQPLTLPGSSALPACCQARQPSSSRTASAPRLTAALRPSAPWQSQMRAAHGIRLHVR